MSQSYAWISRHTSGATYVYTTDIGTGHSCTDEAAENENRLTVTIATWEDEQNAE